mgnify:CR=1
MSIDIDTTFIIGCFVLLCCSTLAAAGGIGGGAFNVPILMAIFGYGYKDAVTLSLCTVFGNVISQFLGKFSYWCNNCCLFLNI